MPKIRYLGKEHGFIFNMKEYICSYCFIPAEEHNWNIKVYTIT